MTTKPAVTIVSFGYLHSAPPQAELVLDTRRYLRDPARVRAANLLDATGHDEAVRDMVMDTPGATAAVVTLLGFIYSFPAGHPCTIAIGCAGGRHRSVVLAEEVGRTLRHTEITATVRHLHVHLDRVLTNDEETVMTCPMCASSNVKPSAFGDGYWECQEPDCGADWRPKTR